MKNAMQKDFWREIKHTRSRFFSIMILVALSVAFLSGLKATAPDMKRTGDDYLDSLHLADIQVLSTLGLTDDDITAIRAQDKVEDAEGEYVIDAFASSDSLDAVVKVLSLTGRGINEVLLRDGRMPERADECVVEENMLSLMNIEIGDRITLTPGDDLSDVIFIIAMICGVIWYFNNRNSNYKPNGKLNYDTGFVSSFTNTVS